MVPGYHVHPWGVYDEPPRPAIVLPLGPYVGIPCRMPPSACIANLLGAALPKKLLEVAPGNEAGHWEPIELVSLHDQMLAEAGSRWDDL
jgi:hypothetical protein